MSSRREVLIRIPALLQRETLLETKSRTWKCLKRHYSQGIWQLKSPQPGNQLKSFRWFCGEYECRVCKTSFCCRFLWLTVSPRRRELSGMISSIKMASYWSPKKKKNARIPLTLTFHPHNNAVNSIILKNQIISKRSWKKQNINTTITNFI